VYVGAVPKKTADVWLNRIEQLSACRIAGVAPDTDLAAWVGSLPKMSHEKLVHAGLVEAREVAEREAVTVVRLTAAFVERSPTKQITIRGFQQTPDSLGAFFGADKTIESITAENADAWRVWVVKDKERSGRWKKKRATEDNRLSPPTVAKRVSVASDPC
jgi:hypothetical protein